MRELPVRLPPMAPPKRAGPWRDATFFLISFLAVFVGGSLTGSSRIGEPSPSDARSSARPGFPTVSKQG